MAKNETTLSLAFKAKTQVWTTIGMWAWILHRLTGLGLVLYIFIHILLMSTSLLRGQQAFDAMLSYLMGHLVFKMLETLVLGAALYHGFNGIRILLFDLGVGIGVRSQKVLFWVFMAIAAILWVFSIAVIF
jgi:succinate dehydrogenase / fumarate reductase cytochrome b subunit